MTIGNRVKQAREAANMSPADLARKVKISRSAIGQIENGMTKSPTATNLEKIAEATGVNAKWLLHGKGPMKPEDGFHPQVSESAHNAGNNSSTSGAQTPATTEVTMTELEYDLLDAFKALGPDEQRMVLTKVQAKAFKAARPGKNPTGRRLG